MAMENRPTASDVPTTLGNRLSTGLVNAGFMGGIGALSLGIFNKGTQLISKKPQVFLKALDWKMVGVIAGVSGLYAFFTANRAKEELLEKAIWQAQANLADPSIPGSQAAKKEQFERSISEIMDGNIPQELQQGSTKFRDKVTQERAVAQATGPNLS